MKYFENAIVITRKHAIHELEYKGKKIYQKKVVYLAAFSGSIITVFLGILPYYSIKLVPLIILLFLLESALIINYLRYKKRFLYDEMIYKTVYNDIFYYSLETNSIQMINGESIYLPYNIEKDESLTNQVKIDFDLRKVYIAPNIDKDTICFAYPIINSQGFREIFSKYLSKDISDYYFHQDFLDSIETLEKIIKECGEYIKKVNYFRDEEYYIYPVPQVPINKNMITYRNMLIKEICKKEYKRALKMLFYITDPKCCSHHNDTPISASQYYILDTVFKIFLESIQSLSKEEKSIVNQKLEKEYKENLKMVTRKINV